MEEPSERALEHVTNMQLMIILNNQEIKANEQYIFYKKVETEKLSAKCDEQKKEIVVLEEKYLSLTSVRIQSENSLCISNECLKTLSDHIIVSQQEKEELEERLETFKNKYADAIKESHEKYEEMIKEYEENTLDYKQLKELQEKNAELEAEIEVLRDDIKTEKKIKEEFTEMKKREFYKAIVQFAETIISYKKNRDTFVLRKQLEKEEIQLLKKYSGLEKQNLFKRSSFAIPKILPPFQMPQFNFQSPLTSRALLNANLMSPRKYGLLQNEESNHKGIIDGIKKRKLNAPAEQGENKRLVNSLQKHQFDASPYFQNLSQGTSQKIQNQNSQGHDSMKTFNNKSHGKVKVIDVTVIPPSPVTFNNTNPNKNQSTNNDTFVQKTQHIPLTSYNSNNERGQFMDPKIKFDNNRPKTSSLAGMNKDATRPLRRESNKNIFSFQKSTNNAEQEPINSQDLLFSQESVTNQLKDNQTGLTPEMIQFKLLSGSRKDNTDEDKENNEVHCEDQGTESQSFVCNEDNYGRSLNNSFSIEPSFRYENANNSSTFGQFDRPNEIPRFQFGDAPNQLNVSGIDVQNYMDTGNENYVCSPINSFLLNTTDEKEDNKDENKNKQSNNFFFKFGECTSKNGPSGQKKLFDMFY